MLDMFLAIFQIPKINTNLSLKVDILLLARPLVVPNVELSQEVIYWMITVPKNDMLYVSLKSGHTEKILLSTVWELIISFIGDKRKVALTLYKVETRNKRLCKTRIEKYVPVDMWTFFD